MIDNQINSNGSYPLQTYPGQSYVFAVSGNFGGGSLSLRWKEGASSTAYGSAVTAAGTVWFVAATPNAELVLTGAAAPALIVSIVLADKAGGVLNVAGLGTGVATALAKPTGTNGAVQIYGEPMAPTLLVPPDMTGMTSQVGALGYKNGQLAVGDSVTPGGNLVSNSQRYFGYSQTLNLSSQPKTSAFAKLFGIPIPASRMVDGTQIRMTGTIRIYSLLGASSFAGLTSHCVGRCLLAGSTVQDGPSGPTAWSKLNFSDIADFTNASLVIDFLWQPTVFSGSQTNHWLARRTVNNVPGLYGASSMGGAQNVSFTPGVANELCFMFQAKSGNAGTYGIPDGILNYEYQVSLEYLN